MNHRTYTPGDRLAIEEVGLLAKQLDTRITEILTSDTLNPRDRAMASRHLIRLCTELKSWTPRNNEPPKG